MPNKTESTQTFAVRHFKQDIDENNAIHVKNAILKQDEVMCLFFSPRRSPPWSIKAIHLSLSGRHICSRKKCSRKVYGMHRLRLRVHSMFSDLDAIVTVRNAREESEVASLVS